MAKVSPAQTNFNGGEFSPLIYGRVDSERYKSGMKTCLRYVPMIQGPLLRCPGTAYVAPTAIAGSKVARLRRFQFSVTDNYMLEFSDLKMRVYRNNAAVLEASQAITGLTQANPCVLTYAGADSFANGDEVEVDVVVGMTQVNKRRFTVANVNAGANTFELAGVNSTGYTAYVSGGTVAKVFTLTTPYAEADLFALNFRQSADVLYVAHQNYAPRKITRTGHTSWTVTAIDFLDGPYLPANSTATTITPSATTGAGITLTASAATFTLVTDVGRLVRLKHSSTWGYAKITAVGTTTSATATVISAFGAATATANWRLGLWSDTTKYPGVVTFHEDRLSWGASYTAPQRVDMSKSGDYENMAPTDTAGAVASDNAISSTLNSNDVQVIRWMESVEKGLLVGTVAAEWIVRASSQGEALTPTNISAKPVTFFGSAAIQPVVAGSAVMFVQRAGSKIREADFVVSSDKFSAPDLSFIAEHILTNGVKQIAFAQEPQSIIWAARNDGVLIGCTYERDINGAIQAGWHRHILGGRSDANGSAPVVESVDTMPSADGSTDQLWMVVKRYIGGQTVRYIEYLTDFFEDEDAQEDAFFVDCGIRYDGASTSTVSGLWHLEGETISVWADGSEQPDVTVSSGAVTLSSAAAKVSLGYGYNSDGRTLRPEAGAADGTALGKTRRTHRFGFLFHRTLGVKFGQNFESLDEVIFRTTSDPIGEMVPLFSGIKSEIIDADYDFENEICWRQNTPAPGAILAVFPQMVTQDR